MILSLQFWGPIMAGAIGAAGTALIGRLGFSAGQSRSGWRLIKPSSMHWGGLIGASGFIALLAYVGLFVGSARADAAFQMRMLWLIVAGFLVSAATCLWQMRRIQHQHVEWRGSQIAFTAANGRRHTRSMEDVVLMRRPYFGLVQIVFGDGLVLKLDPFAQGTPELWNRIVEADEG